MAVTPVFYTIASLYYSGYNLTQRGSHVVLEAANIDSPFQLWYKDDSWQYVEDSSGNPAFALINNGTKAALQAASAAPSKVSLVHNYVREKDTDLTTAWTLYTTDSEGTTNIVSVALSLPLRLGIGKSPPTIGDNVAAILGTSSSSTTTTGWSLQPFEPKTYLIQTQWVDQILVPKEPHTDVTFTYGSGSFNNELTVVVVHSINADGEQEVWYRVPAGSPLEDSNSAFIIISKKNGKALKGSAKSGDKVILTEFDPLDNNFVWSERRGLTASTNYLAINLAINIENPLNWFVPADAEYQNAAYNHPLALREVTTTLSQAQWRFVATTTS